MGSLPANLFSAEILSSTLKEIAVELETRYPNFRLLHMNAEYYYKNADCLCTRFKNKIYVNIRFPIADINSAVKVYDVIKYPLQFPGNSSLLSELSQVSKHFIMAVSQDFYIETDKLAVPLENFQIQVMRPMSHDSCLLALYLGNTLSIHKLCQYIVRIDDGMSELFVIDLPLVFIRHISVFNVSCAHSVTTLKGGSYCLFNIPCGCAIQSPHAIIPARISRCESTSNSKTPTPILQFNFNLPLLLHFLSNDSWHLFTQLDLLNSPLSVHLPEFRLFNHSLLERLATSQRLNLALDKLVNATKADQIIYSTALDPILAGEINFGEFYFQSLPGYLTIASIVLSGVNFLIIFVVII